MRTKPKERTSEEILARAKRENEAWGTASRIVNDYATNMGAWSWEQKPAYNSRFNNAIEPLSKLDIATLAHLKKVFAENAATLGAENNATKDNVASLIGEMAKVFKNDVSLYIGVLEIVASRPDIFRGYEGSVSLRRIIGDQR